MPHDPFHLRADLRSENKRSLITRRDVARDPSATELHERVTENRLQVAAREPASSNSPTHTDIRVGVVVEHRSRDEIAVSLEADRRELAPAIDVRNAA